MEINLYIYIFRSISKAYNKNIFISKKYNRMEINLYVYM